MMPDRNKEGPTPLVEPHDRDGADGPRPVEPDAPVSTDGDGRTVELPDRGGKID